MLRVLLWIVLATSAWAQTVPLCGQGTNFACKANLSINIKDYLTAAMCAGTADPDTAIQSALTAAAGRTLFIPAGCKPRLKNTGATSATNLTIPPSTTIICEDATAGFAVVRQRCMGGRYLGAACTLDEECLGGTTGDCAYDYGSARYASTAGQTYTMFSDQANVNSQNIVIENCSFWADQADPYQRCAGTGGNVGKPCRQECSDATTNPFDGFRCEADGDCLGGGAGSCLNRSDCTGSGGTNSCGAAPGIPSTTSTAKINVLDLQRTSNVRLVNVSVYDHFQGDFAIKTGANATMRNVNAARELTDGTTPFTVGNGGTGQTPTGSICLGSNAPVCFYGAYGTANVQPTTAVTNGIVVGVDSQLIRVTGRGSTTSITAGIRSRLDECTVWPYSANGPGTAAAGYSVGQLGQVAKSQAQWLASGATGIALTGTDATAIENKLAFATSNSNSIGIDMQAANQHATGNNIAGIGGSSGIGIKVSGAYADVKTNYVAMSNGAGVYVNAADATITGNQLISNPVESMLYGIQCNSCNSMVAEGNQIERVLTASIKLTAGFFMKIIGNTSNLVKRVGAVAPVINSTVKPIHILDDGTNSNQKSIAANTFNGGWRGYDVGTRVGGLLNASFGNNRFQELGGAAVVAGGGAGVNLSGGNYFNSTGSDPNGPVTVCNATCSNRGAICVKDADCTSCAASTLACTPEPIIWLSSPNSNSAGAGAAHPTISGNLIFNGWSTGTTFPMVRQCVSPTTNNVGQICETSTSSGSGCTGGSGCTLVSSGANTGMYLCSGGTDDGKRCCSGGTPTCSVRQPYALIRYADTNSANSYVDMAEISGNLIFSANTDNEVGIDFCEGNKCDIGATGVTFTDVMIGGNQFKSYGAGSSNYGIRFPTTYASIVRNAVTGNNFTNMSGGPAKNWASAMGVLLANGGLPSVVHAMTWFFPGLPTAGVQTPIGIVRAGLTNCAITGAQIAIGTVAANNSVWNIQRCTANCDGSSAATFADIWSADDTINNDKYNVKSSGTLTTTIASGDLFKVDLSTVGASTADYSVTMTYVCDQ